MKRKSLNAQKINHNFISNLLNKDFIKPIFSKFEKKLNSRESFLVAVSGGPDSLALAFLSKCYEEKYGARTVGHSAGKSIIQYKTIHVQSRYILFYCI